MRRAGIFALLPSLLLLPVTTLPLVACGDDADDSADDADDNDDETNDDHDDDETHGHDQTDDGTDTDGTDTDGTDTDGTDTDGTDTDGTDTDGTDTDTDTDTGTDETMAISVSFGAAIGNQRLDCARPYNDVGTSNSDVELRDLRFFVQDLQLLRASDGEPVPVAFDVVEPWQAETVALIDLEDGAGFCEDGGGNGLTNSVITGRVPMGDYDGVVFTVGVPEDLNHGDPLTAPQPLHASNMIWSWLSGYKFIKLEVVEVLGDIFPGDDSPTPGQAVVHLGSTGCTGNPGEGTVECIRPNRNEIVLESFDPTFETIVLDVGVLLADTDMTDSTNTCHGMGPLCPTVFPKFGLSVDTGLPTDSQTVFSARWWIDL